MITVLYGESQPEPYCIDARKAKALEDVNTEGLNYDSLKGTFDAEVAGLARTLPMFEKKRGIVLEVGSLKDLDNKCFEEYISRPAKTCELVIICQSADKRTKMYKRLAEGKLKGVTAFSCDKKDVTKDKLVKTILYELKKEDAKITKEGMELFLERIDYSKNKDMNLLTATGYLKPLTAVTKEIGPAEIETYVPSFKEADAFLLVALLIKGDIRGLYEQVNMASPKEAIRILCLLLRSFRIAWKRKYFDNVSADGTEALGKYDAETLKRCIGVINETVSAIKTGYMSDELALKVACGKLAACMNI